MSNLSCQLRKIREPFILINLHDFLHKDCWGSLQLPFNFLKYKDRKGIPNNSCRICHVKFEKKGIPLFWSTCMISCIRIIEDPFSYLLTSSNIKIGKGSLMILVKFVMLSLKNKGALYFGPSPVKNVPLRQISIECSLTGEPWSLTFLNCLSLYCLSPLRLFCPKL